METSSILNANILDIIFDERNKGYGAYDLRRTYEKRVSISLGITSFIIIVFTGFTLWKNTTSHESTIMPPTIFDPVNPVTPYKPKPLPLAPKPVQIKSFMYTKPQILEDSRVKEPPVEIEQLVAANIDVKSVAGDDYKGISAPVEIKKSQVIEVPVSHADPGDIIFKSVEIDAKFSGNWNSYVKNEIEKNIDELTEAGESGTCIVRFVVSKDGSVSNVEAITMKGSKLAEIAVNAIRKGPKWIPAMQNGIQVNAYRQQPVTFVITN